MDNINDQLKQFVKNINYLFDEKEDIRRLIDEQNIAQKDDYLQKAKSDIDSLKMQIDLGRLYLRMTDNPYAREWSLKQDDQLQKINEQLVLVESGNFTRQPRINKRFAKNAVRAALLDPTKRK